MACTATSYSLSRVMDTMRSCPRERNGEVRHTSALISLQRVGGFSKCVSVVGEASELHLEATGEELQPSAQLSVVEQALQGGQTLQPHLSLLEKQKHTVISELRPQTLNQARWFISTANYSQFSMIDFRSVSCLHHRQYVGQFPGL